MKRAFLASLVLTIAFGACKNAQFNKLEKGLEYKIIENGSGDKVKQGDYIQYHMSKFYQTDKGDSLLADTRNTTGAVLNMVDSAGMGPYYKMITQLRKGDSLVMRILTDSVFSDGQQEMAPFMKKGHHLITTLKVVNIFKDQKAADSAMQIEQKRMEGVLQSIGAEQAKKDEADIQAYLSKNNVKTVKGRAGTYVEVLQPGSGPNIDSTNVVYVNYTGRTLNGAKPFDSNTDPAYQHVEPLPVNFTSDPTLGTSVIPGWMDGLQMLNKGAKARFYIPSELGYGQRGMLPDIAPNSVLVFDVEVVDVLNKAAAKVKMDEYMKRQQAAQARMMDSIRRSMPDTTNIPR